MPALVPVERLSDSAAHLESRTLQLKIFGVEPVECAMTYEHLHNMREECRPHRIEGIADGFVPKIIYDNIKLLNRIIRIDSSDAIQEARRIAREHGCFVGICSGANLLAAKKVRSENPSLETIVTVFTDEGEKVYIRKVVCKLKL